MRYTQQNLAALSKKQVKSIFDHIVYNGFRTGSTFASVREELKIESIRKYKEGQYMQVSRSTVLGRLRERKLEMYQEEIGNHSWNKNQMIHMIMDYRWWIKGNRMNTGVPQGDLPF